MKKWTFLLRKWTFSQVGGSSDRTPLGMGLFNEHYAFRLHRHMLTLIPYPNYYSIPHDTRSLVLWSSAVQAATDPAAVVPLQTRVFSWALLWLAPRKVILHQASSMSIHLASLLMSPSMSRYLLFLRRVATCWLGVEWPLDPWLSKRYLRWGIRCQRNTSLFASSPSCHRWLVQKTVAQ